MNHSTLPIPAQAGSPGTRIMQAIQAKNEMMLKRTAQADHREQGTGKAQEQEPLTRVGGALAVHCEVDLAQRCVTDVAAMSTVFRGYEAMLPGKSLDQVGRVSSTASGICGGVHATASSLCLEMAFGIKPPPFGLVLRNLLLSCQYLNDNTMHLYVLAGPDYSEEAVKQTNPELWQTAQSTSTQHKALHGYSHIADIMSDLNKGKGKLCREAMQKVSLARQAYICLGGKYPHSESIVPGGVCLNVDGDKLAQFTRLIQPFAEFSHRTAAIWNDIFDFFYHANPAYQELGKTTACLLDFGQWDHPDYYDATYQHCDMWGSKRWSSPAVVIDGKLRCSQLSRLNAELEESFAFSYQRRHDEPGSHTGLRIEKDALGNAISPLHPWNKRMGKPEHLHPDAYSWGSSLTWQGNSFEVGAYSRLYLTAAAQTLPDCQYLMATGRSLEFDYRGESGQHQFGWQIPGVWNAFERNRARACALGFNYSVMQENLDLAQRLLAQGETQTQNLRTLESEQAASASNQSEATFGVGLWGASRGFLAHWAVIKNHAIDNYQISIPSRVNVGTRSPDGQLGPLEKALAATPVLESQFRSEADFVGIDIQRTIQSFDPCMSCTAHYLFANSDSVIDKVIETS